MVILFSNIPDGDQNIFRAETRTPGLSRKSNSTLSLVNDVEMEVGVILVTILTSHTAMQSNILESYSHITTLFRRE